MLDTDYDDPAMSISIIALSILALVGSIYSIVMIALVHQRRRIEPIRFRGATIIMMSTATFNLFSLHFVLSRIFQLEQKGPCW